MPHKKTPKVSCPAYDCQGGYPGRLHEVNEKIKEIIPSIILDRLGQEKPVFRCSYCGFVWGQKVSKQGVINVIPLGFYDNSQNPNEFLPVPENYKTK